MSVIIGSELGHMLVDGQLTAQNNFNRVQQKLHSDVDTEVTVPLLSS